MKISEQFDYSKLDGKITELFGTRSDFATAMGLSKATLSLKMNGKIDWRQQDIALACALLQIDKSEVGAYFFNKKV